MGQSVDGFAEVISRLRFSSDEGAKYSGDLLAIMEILKNTTKLYKGNGLRLSNANVEVSGCPLSCHLKRLRDVFPEQKIVFATNLDFCVFLLLCLNLMRRTMSRLSATC